MRARITITLAVVASLAALVVALGVLQPTVSTAAPDTGVCVSVGVPNPEPPSAAEAAELKRAEAEIGKPIARMTIGEQHCFATDAEAREFIATLERPAD